VRDPSLIELTVKSVMRGIVPGHGFDHERLNGFQDSSFILRRVHFGDVRGVGGRDVPSNLYADRKG